MNWLYVVVPIVAVILGFITFVASRPNKFRIERSKVVAAPPDVVFPLVNDLHEWARWSPFEKLDPNMKKTFDGPPSGPGAISAWSGNNKAGEGRMTILENESNQKIAIKLEFFKPFQATNAVTFLFVPENGGTKVSWIMEGTSNFMMKFFHIVMNMDKMLSATFDEGLANLNRVAQEQTA